MGILLAIETVKFRLEISVELTDIFYFDLIRHTFDNQFSTSDRSYSNFDLSGYEMKNSLNSANVLTIGAGGYGCPANLVLALAGVKNLSLIDFDHVKISQFEPPDSPFNLDHWAIES